MPLTNFPGGVSGFGVPLVGQGTVYDMPWGPNVWFVNNRATPSFGGTPGTSRDLPFQSLADALARAQPFDVIYVGPGHAENITASMVFSGTASGGPNTGAQAIPAGVRIIGEGAGTNRPTFTLTAVASTIALAAANCSIENIRILCPQTGTTTTTAMVTVTAAGCAVRQCQFQGSSSATALCTTGISLSSAANDCQVTDCTGFTVTGTPTAWLATTGTAAATRVQVLRNTIRWLMSGVAVPVLDFTSGSVTPPTDWLIADNALANLTAASTVVIKGVASATGQIVFNYLETVAGTAAAVAITTPGGMTMYQNFVSQGGKQAIAITTGGNAS
jgi:hypothetical protein